MLYDFVGTEKMNNDEMVKKLATVGRRMGWGGSRGEMERSIVVLMRRSW